jgi:hypothetical protein
MNREVTHAVVVAIQRFRFEDVVVLLAAAANYHVGSSTRLVDLGLRASITTSFFLRRNRCNFSDV